MTAATFPTADHVAHAIVAACREFGEDPIALAEGRKGSSARIVAYAALRERFSAVPDLSLARMLGLRFNASSFVGNARYTMKLPYWDGDRAPRVLRVLAAIPEALATLPPHAPRPVVTVERAPPALRVRTNAGDVVAPMDNEVVRRGPPLKPAPVPPRAAVLRQLAKVQGDVAPALMGDPPPGRSALERKGA